MREPAAAAATTSDAWLFHQSLAGYAPTPLRDAPAAARALGVRSVLVKDETDRLGLPSFKILGASWATYRLICQRVGANPLPLIPLADLAARVSPLRPLEVVAATDGNHGRAVARMARLLGLTAHILVPSDMAPARIAALEAEGARVTMISGGYDDSITASAALADERHLVVSDTSWPGYDEPPGWVIDGYATIALETLAALRDAGRAAPSVVALQIGVGAFAAGVAPFWPDTTRIVGVEPTSADCVVASIEAGRPITLTERQTSIMAGLNCGTPSLLAWPVLARRIDVFAAVTDAEAERAMRLLKDDGITAGESGAAGLAGLLAFRAELALAADDAVLVVVTEGATDPDAYARIVGPGV
jgi:diaminopropionate ammonia-lyase